MRKSSWQNRISIQMLCFKKSYSKIIFIIFQHLNANRLLDVAWVQGGGLNQPAPSRSPQNTVKNQKIFFDFLKVHNELGKVTKFWTSRPLFSWRNSHLKKVRADSAPRTLIGLTLWKFTKFQTSSPLFSWFGHNQPPTIRVKINLIF